MSVSYVGFTPKSELSYSSISPRIFAIFEVLGYFLDLKLNEDHKKVVLFFMSAQ
jgi:hypothetical protein